MSRYVAPFVCLIVLACGTRNTEVKLIPEDAYFRNAEDSAYMAAVALVFHEGEDSCAQAVFLFDDLPEEAVFVRCNGQESTVIHLTAERNIGDTLRTAGFAQASNLQVKSTSSSIGEDDALMIRSVWLRAISKKAPRGGITRISENRREYHFSTCDFMTVGCVGAVAIHPPTKSIGGKLEAISRSLAAVADGDESRLKSVRASVKRLEIELE